jgi:DNA-directed RNA polymerase subunit F
MVAGMTHPAEARSYFEHLDAARREFDLVEWEDPEEITVRIVALTPERADEIRRQIEKGSEA